MHPNERKRLQVSRDQNEKADDTPGAVQVIKLRRTSGGDKEDGLDQKYSGIRKRCERVRRHRDKNAATRQMHSEKAWQSCPLRADPLCRSVCTLCSCKSCNLDICIIRVSNVSLTAGWSGQMIKWPSCEYISMIRDETAYTQAHRLAQNRS
jgi:hypothetical protein